MRGDLIAGLKSGRGEGRYFDLMLKHAVVIVLRTKVVVNNECTLN
jgi:hypothetical protein